MLNRKLLEMLARLEEPDLKRLRLYIASPFFTRHLRKPTAVLQLYDYILSHRADEHSPALAKPVVFKKFFPERTYQEGIKSPLDTLASDLFGLIKNYLSYKSWENDNQNKDDLFAQLRFYRRHGLEDRFQQTLESLRKKQEVNPYRDAQYYLTQFRIEEEVSNLQGMSNTFEDDANLFAAQQSLDSYYCIVKLEHICALLYQRQFSNIEFSLESDLIQAVLHVTGTANGLDIPLIIIYTSIFKLLQPGSGEQDLLQLKSLLEKYENDIPSDKYRDVMTYYRYFCVRRYFNSGDHKHLRQIFLLYKHDYEKGYFYFEGLITVHILRTLLTIALKVKQYDWAKALLDMHPPQRICGTRFPVEAHSLNYAEYYFSIKDYEQASRQLIYRHFENPNFSILADVLNIKIYFETSNDLLVSRIKALDQKVRRTKISPENKQRYYNFLNSLYKIINYGWKKNDPKREKLIEEIKSMPNIIQREWLLEKLGIETT